MSSGKELKLAHALLHSKQLLAVVPRPLVRREPLLAGQIINK